MKKLLVQEGVFSEDEYFAPLDTIRKYFDVTLISDEEIIKNEIPKFDIFRGSLALAKKMGRKFKYANALNFVPHFRDEIIDRETYFTDLGCIKDRSFLFKLFVRPVSPFKEFSGNVFTAESFENEYNFTVRNKNISPDLICMVSEPKNIGREWRTIFINGEYVSGSQYMKNGELDVVKEIPEEVVNYAKRLAEDDYFLNIFEFVIDVAELDYRLALVEVNGFETASFYGADLDLVYKTWSEV